MAERGCFVLRWGLHLEHQQPQVPSPSQHKPGTFPNAIDAESPAREDTKDVAIDYASILLSQEFHEILEWVKVDGLPLAQAHPELDAEGFITGDSYSYWTWLQDRFRQVVLDYMDEFPWTPVD